MFFHRISLFLYKLQHTFLSKSDWIVHGSFQNTGFNQSIFVSNYWLFQYTYYVYLLLVISVSLQGKAFLSFNTVYGQHWPVLEQEIELVPPPFLASVFYTPKLN